EYHVLTKPSAASGAGTAPAPAAALSTLSIDVANGVASVSGAVHDDETRGSILDGLKAVFGSDNVSGDIAVDPNRAAPPWLANLRAALDALRVPGLKALFDGADIKLGGAIPEADRDKIAASLKSVFGDGLT